MTDWEMASAMLQKADAELARHPQESYQSVQEWLLRHDGKANAAFLGDAWDLTGRYHNMFGRDLDANHAFEKALRFAGEAGDKERHCRYQKNLGIALMQMKAYHIALRCFLDVREIAVREGYLLLEGQADNNIAVIHNINGNYEAARVIFTHLLEHADEMGLSRAIAHYNLADVNLMLGDLDKVAPHIRAGCQAAAQEGRQNLRAGFSMYFGMLMRRRHRPLFAGPQLERTLNQCLENHLNEEFVRCSYELVQYYGDIGDLGQMMRHCRETIDAGKTYGMMDEAVLAYERMIAAHRARGNDIAAWEASREYAAFLTQREAHDAIRTRLLMEMELNRLDDGLIQRRLERELAIDPLTGLNSFRVLNKRILSSRSQIHAPSAVLFLDLDYLKQVNDTHGHGVGDKLIMAFAREIQNALPPGGIATRKSGDEFVIFLPDTDESSAVHFAESFLKNAAMPREIGSILLPLACSIGISTDQGNAMEPDLLVEWADMAMLEAKRSGRSRVAVAHGAHDAHVGGGT